MSDFKISSFPNFLTGKFSLQLNKKTLAAVLLSLFILLYLVQNYWFIRIDTGPKMTDYQYPLSLMFYEKLIRGATWPELAHQQYPPLAYLIANLFYVFWGTSSMVARLSIQVFTVIFLLSMFGIGYKLGKYPGAFSATLLAGASPYVLKYSKLYFLDFPQAAMTALSLYLLLKTEGFRDRKYSLLFGLALAGALLTKWTTAFFISLPVLWFVVPLFSRNRRFLTVMKIFSPLAGFSILGTAWYFRQAQLGQPVSETVKFYALFILAPVILYVLIVQSLEKKWKEKSVPTDDPAFRMLNFSYVCSIIALIALPWYYWTAATLVRTDMPLPGVPGTLGHMIKIVTSSINFFPILVTAGIVVMVIKQKDRYLRRLFPAGLVFTFLIYYKIWLADFRYFPGFVIFTSAMATFWIIHLGRFRYLATAAVGITCLLSIFSGTLIPGDCFFYTPFKSAFENPLKLAWAGIISQPPPDTSVIRLKEVVKNMSPVEGPWKAVMVIYTSRRRTWKREFFDELILEKTFEAGKPVDPMFSWDLKELREMVSKLEKNRIGYEEWLRIESVENVLIIHRKNKDPGKALTYLKKMYPERNLRVKTFAVGEGYRITLVKFAQ